MGRRHHAHPGLRRQGNQRKAHAGLLERNPVANAIAMQQGLQRIQQYHRNVAINLYVQPAGDDATALLCKLGWVIGLATEAERAAAGFTPRMRMLHGGLRHIQQICLSGYRWPDHARAGFDAQLQAAVETLQEHPQHALAMMEGADVLEAQIRQHKVTADSVAGAEIYQQEAA